MIAAAVFCPRVHLALPEQLETCVCSVIILVTCVDVLVRLLDTDVLCLSMIVTFLAGCICAECALRLRSYSV